jgi:hypothetical protein
MRQISAHDHRIYNNWNGTYDTYGTEVYPVFVIVWLFKKKSRLKE